MPITRGGAPPEGCAPGIWQLQHKYYCQSSHIGQLISYKTNSHQSHAFLHELNSSVMECFCQLFDINDLFTIILFYFMITDMYLKLLYTVLVFYLSLLINAIIKHYGHVPPAE